MEPGLGEEVVVRVSRLYRLIAAEIGTGGPSVSQARTLARLADSPPQRVSTLAAAERLSQPSTTVLVSRMERAGWVTRGTDPADRRVVTVAITDAGRAELSRVRVASGRALDARLAVLTAAERAALRAALPVLDRLVELPGPDRPAHPVRGDGPTGPHPQEET